MKNAAIINRWLGRNTSTVEERIVAPNAYGRSVCVVSASTNVTKITVGSLNAPNDRSRLDPSCAYGLPESTAASDTTKLANARISPTPRKSAMYPSGNPNVVSAGINSGTVAYAAKLTYGAARNTGPAGAGNTVSFCSSLTMS